MRPYYFSCSCSPQREPSSSSYSINVHLRREPSLRPHLSTKYISDINPLDAFLRGKVCDMVLTYLLKYDWFDSGHRRIRNSSYALVLSLVDDQLPTTM